MFQCIEVVGIPDITEIRNNSRYTINIYFNEVWAIGYMQGDEIVKLVNKGIRVEFHNI
jgi:hypothetical protein